MKQQTAAIVKQCRLKKLCLNPAEPAEKLVVSKGRDYSRAIIGIPALRFQWVLKKFVLLKGTASAVPKRFVRNAALAAEVCFLFREALFQQWRQPLREYLRRPRTFLVRSISLSIALTATPLLPAQARDIPNAGPTHPADQTQEQRGRKLLDQMLEALGGDAWLNRHNVRVLGHLGRFFQGAPNGIVIDFTATHQFASGDRPEAQRIGFITDKSMILPGKKIDIVQIWIDNTGHEVTYKGNITLPKDQIEDYYRRQAHSIESIYRVWLKSPGVVVIDEGSTMVERRLTERVTILSDNNDAVTVDIDIATHLPRRRTFEWRNTTFKDRDEDAEEYDDYHTIQGLPTAFTLTRYHNGDMSSQTFYTKVEYDVDLPPGTFNPEILLKKKQ